jgi:hypothetical protein
MGYQMIGAPVDHRLGDDGIVSVPESWSPVDPAAS